MTNPPLRDLLDQRQGLPAGDAADWRDRYGPLVDDIVRHRRIESADVSVVVVGWESSDEIIDSLASVRAQRGIEDFEVVLVDNGGLEPVRHLFAEYVDLELRMRGNVRLCRARNAAVAWANGDLVAFVDDDGRLRDDYLKNVLPYFRSEAVVGIRSRIVADEHPYLTALAAHYDRGPEPVEDCLVTEGSSVLRRKAYLEAGGFAESLAGHEGIDLTFRLKRCNPDARVLYAPDVVMAHDYFDSVGHLVDKSLNYADIDTDVVAERPEIEGFLARYFSREYPGPRLSFDQHVAAALLSAIRSFLEVAARASDSVARFGHRGSDRDREDRCRDR